MFADLALINAEWQGAAYGSTSSAKLPDLLNCPACLKEARHLSAKLKGLWKYVCVSRQYKEAVRDADHLRSLVKSRPMTFVVRDHPLETMPMPVTIAVIDGGEVLSHCSGV